MVDYSFYRDTYLGEGIPQENWECLGLRAQALLKWLQNRFTLSPSHPQSEAFAVCALAELLHRQEPEGLVQKTLGEVTLRYEKRPGFLRSCLLAVLPWYWVYRGVGA